MRSNTLDSMGANNDGAADGAPQSSIGNMNNVTGDEDVSMGDAQDVRTRKRKGRSHRWGTRTAHRHAAVPFRAAFGA
jgi:hypothetical protein